MTWKPMTTAPKDREILVRRHNGVGYEYYLVWWDEDDHYQWRSDYSAYPDDQLDAWHEIPGTAPSRPEGKEAT